MADLKFSCPECQQRILVDDGAAGVQIDCPTCRSTLVIPAKATDNVTMVKRRRLVVASTTPDAAYEELDRKKKELTAALAEAKQLKKDGESSEKELAKLRRELAATGTERDGLRAKGEQAGGELKRLTTDLEKARAEAEKAGAEAKRLAALAAKPAPAPEVPPRADLEKELAGLREQLTEARKTAPMDELRGQIKSLSDAIAALTAERDGLKTKAGQADAELARLRIEFNATKETLDAQSKNLRDLSQSFATSERERVELERKAKDPVPMSELNAARERAAGLQTQLTEAQDAAEKLRRDSEQLRKQLAGREDSAAKSKELQTRVEALAADLQTRERELSEVRAQHGTASAAHEIAKGEAAKAAASAAVVVAELDSLRKGGAKLRLDLQSATERATAAEKRVAELEAEIGKQRIVIEAARENAKLTEELQHRIENLQTDLKVRALELTEAQKNLGVARTEREGALAKAVTKEKEAAAIAEKLSSEAAAARARAEELQKRVETLTADAAKLRKELEPVHAEREAAAKLLAAKDAEARDLSAQIAQARTTEKELRAQLQTAETSLVPMQEKVRMIEADRDRLKVNYDRVSGEVDGAATLSQQAKIDQEKAKAMVKEMERQLERALDQVRDLEAERGRLREDMDGFRQGLERSKQHIGVLQTRRDQMREEIAKLRVKLGMAPEAVA